MMTRRLIYLWLILWALSLPGIIRGQDMVVQTEQVPLETPENKLDIEARLSLFMDDLNQLYTVGSFRVSIDGKMGVSKSLVATMQQRIKHMNQTYNNLDVKWNTYYQAQQLEIAADEELMDQVAKIEELKQIVKDTLDARSTMTESLSKFVAADEFIIGHVDVYKKLYQKAFKLSLIKKTAPLLEKVKAKEQVVFTDVQTNFDEAKAACEVVPSLKPRLDVLDEQYVIIKSVSEKVQALEYKPWMTRVKDYVMGLAAVSIILMFLNGMWSKFKAYKEKAKSLKKYNEMLKNNGKEKTYPTI